MMRHLRDVSGPLKRVSLRVKQRNADGVHNRCKKGALWSPRKRDVEQMKGVGMRPQSLGGNP